LVLAIAGQVRANSYDPLAVDSAFHPLHVDLTVHDAARNRDIPVRVYLPKNSAPAPVILFSHGLDGSRTASVFLGEHWVARGYAAVFLQHPGSDDSVWKGQPGQQRMRAMKQAASRLAVYPALHDAPKYEVVLHNAEHSAFTDRALPGDREPRNPNHHRVILALSTAFWDAYLRSDADALAWLNGPGPRAIMEPDDRWQFSVP